MERLTLNSLEQARLHVLNRVLQGQCSVVQAAGLLALSERHVWRLLAAYRKEGPDLVGMAHGNRGRKPVHTIPEEIKGRVRELAERPYSGLNHCHPDRSGSLRSERVFTFPPQGGAHLVGQRGAQSTPPATSQAPFQESALSARRDAVADRWQQA